MESPRRSLCFPLTKKTKPQSSQNTIPAGLSLPDIKISHRAVAPHLKTNKKVVPNKSF